MACEHTSFAKPDRNRLFFCVEEGGILQILTIAESAQARFMFCLNGRVETLFIESLSVGS